MKHYVLLLLSFAGLLPASVFAQRVDPPEIVQSPYYDAVVLSYAFKGYKAYPVLVDSVMQQTAGTMGNPYGAQVYLKHYQVIESATGKITGDLLIQGNSIPASYMAKPQYLFKDSLEQKNLVYEVLARNAGTDNLNRVRDLYSANPYLKMYLDSLRMPPKDKSGTPGPDLTGINATDAFDKTGGAVPGISMLAEGLAEFYMERVNEEVNDAFFIHLQAALKKSAELQLLFPKTLESLDKIAVTDYNMSLNAIKAAYEEDMRNLLPDIAKLGTLKKYRNMIDAYPDLTMLFTTCDLVDLLHHNNPPADILYRIGQADYITQTKPNPYNAFIRMTCLVSYCMRDIQVNDDNKNQAGWISEAKLDYLETHPDVYRIFMGLFAQRAGGISLQTGSTSFNLQTALFQNDSAVLGDRNLVYNFTRSAEDIQLKLIKISGLRSADKTSAYIAAYIGVFNSILGLSETCLDIIPSERTTEARKEIKKIKASYVPIAREANSVLEKIETQEYCMAVYAADSLINRVLYRQVRVYNTRMDSVRQAQRESSAKLGASDKKGKEALDKTAKHAINTIDGQKDLALDSISPFHKEFLHYGLFIASVASAKNAADVKQAISAFALPKGSSRIKKEHRFSVGLNSYVGFYQAWNRPYAGLKIPYLERGLTAPLGLGVNFGLSKFGSLSLYGGIIDIGAIFTYKIAGDSSSVQSDIRLSQIISPSVSVIYGFPIIKKYNIPLSLGFSSQWGPRLQKVSPAGNSELPLMTQHWNLFIGIDIPIVNFYTSKR